MASKEAIWELEKIQAAIKENDETSIFLPPSSSDYVICPYCGYAYETNLGYADMPALYEEGTVDEECPECGKKYILETYVSYYYTTYRKETNYEMD